MLLVCLALALNGCIFGWPVDVRQFIADSPPSPQPRATVVPSPFTTSAPAIPHSPTGKGVYLAPLGEFPAEVIAEIAEWSASKYGIDVQVLSPSSLDPSAFDPVRDQYVAEGLVDALMDSYPRAVADRESVIIGLLVDDLHIRDRTDWAWAFGIRDDAGYAVVSTARMGSLEEPVAPIVKSRLRKMVLRDIGVLYYGLPLNDDPISVLYADVLSVDDLDRMSEELCGADCPGRA